MLGVLVSHGRLWHQEIQADLPALVTLEVPVFLTAQAILWHNEYITMSVLKAMTNAIFHVTE
jgi:hypothetical protein